MAKKTKKSDMQVVLQHRKSHLYLRSAKSWTRYSGKAKDFEHVSHAHKFERQHHLTNTEIILVFEFG